MLLEGQCGFRKGKSCMQFSDSLDHASSKPRQAINCTLASLTLAKPTRLWLCWHASCLGAFYMLGSPSQDATAYQGLTWQYYMCHASRQGWQSSWFQVSTGSQQGDVNAMFFKMFLDSICRFGLNIESKAGDLGLKSTYNIDGHSTGCRKPNGSVLPGSYNLQMTWSSLRRIVSRFSWHIWDVFTNSSPIHEVSTNNKVLFVNRHKSDVNSNELFVKCWWKGGSS